MGFFFTHTIFYSWLICPHFLRDSCWTCYLCWSCFSMIPPGITIMSNPGTLNEHIYFTIPFLYSNKQNHTKTFHWLKSIQIFLTIIGQLFFQQQIQTTCTRKSIEIYRTLTCTIFLPNKSTFTPKYLLTLVSLLPYKQQRSLRRRGG